MGPKRRAWLKLHVLSDVDTGEAIAFAVTDKTVGDPPLMIPLLDAAVAAGHRIGTVLPTGHTARRRTSITSAEDSEQDSSPASK